MDIPHSQQRERLLHRLAAAAFLIFFNGYLVAPLIPAFAREFAASEYDLGWAVPAYLIPYGLSTLGYGALSDRLGRRPLLLVLLAVAALTSAATALAWSPSSLIAIRVLAGLGSGGVVTVALAVVGDLYPYAELGRPMGWMFGAIAGGMAFGATLGAWLNPILGWRREFLILAGADLVALAALARSPVPGRPARAALGLAALARGYGALLGGARGRRTYAFIFLNGMFHGGVFAWLGTYLVRRHHLDDAGIGRALLGYGVPGVLLGPVWGRLADRLGRDRIIPPGFVVAAACALGLAAPLPLWAVTLCVTLLSVGLDMTHPLLSGIVADLDPPRRGQALGLNTFAIFSGLGLGAIAFQNLMLGGLGLALLIFGLVQLLLGLLAVHQFRGETTRPRSSVRVELDDQAQVDGEGHR